MGAHESKQYRAAELNQYAMSKAGRRFKIRGGNKGKRRTLQLMSAQQLDPAYKAQQHFQPEDPQLTSISVDESSVATIMNTEYSFFLEDPEHHCIELTTINAAAHTSPDGLVRPQVKPSHGLGSKSSAFQSYKSSGRRKRAFAVDWSTPRRARVTRGGRETRNQSSYSSPHLLARRTWLLSEADRYEKQGNFSLARPYLEECIRLDESVQVHFLAAAFVYHKLGVLTWTIGAYYDSVAVLTRCLSLFNSIDHRLSNLDEIQGLARALIALGRAYTSLTEYDPAIEYIWKGIGVLNAAISSRPEVLDTMNPLIAQALLCMGIVDDARGRSIQAMNTFQRCLRIQRTCRDGCQVDEAATLNRIGGIHGNRGEYIEAMVCYSEALRIYRSQIGKGCSPLDVAVTLNHVGFVHYAREQYDQALAAFREALSIFSLLLGPYHRNIATTKFSIAQIYIGKGVLFRGLLLLKQVLRAQRVSLGDDHPDIAVTLEAIAAANEDLGRLSRACSYLEKALSIRKMRGSLHLLTARTHAQLGQLHHECGRDDSARHCFYEALVVYRSNAVKDDDLRILSMKKWLAHLDRADIPDDKPKGLIFRRERLQQMIGSHEEEMLFDYTDDDTARCIL